MKNITNILICFVCLIILMSATLNLNNNTVQIDANGSITTSGNIQADRVVTVTLIEQFDSGDNMSIRWFGETTAVFLNYSAATGHIPVVPSIILTVNLIGL